MGVVQPNRCQERYGISEESFANIQRQVGMMSSSRQPPQEQKKPIAKESKDQLTLSQSITVRKLTDALEYQANQFNRYKQLAEMKFTSLSKDLLDLSMQLKEAQKTIAQFKDKFELVKAREELLAYQRGDSREPLDRPIDRNGVSPKDVQIEDIFNCANKKF